AAWDAARVAAQTCSDSRAPQSGRYCGCRDHLAGGVQEAARAIAPPIHILNASTNSEIDAAFAALARERADALFVMANNYYHSRRVQLAVLAARYRIPAIFSQREFVEAGGLMSYGTDIADSIRQAGFTPAKFSRALSRPICRSCSRPSSSSSSICKLRG